MPLGTTEQIIYDYITSDPKRRDFWEKQIKELQVHFPDEVEAPGKLAERLMLVYSPLGDAKNISEIMPLVGSVDILICDWDSIAFKLMGRDLEEELRAAVAQIQRGNNEFALPLGLGAYVTPRRKFSPEEIEAQEARHMAATAAAAEVNQRYRRALSYIFGISFVLAAFLVLGAIRFLFFKELPQFELTGFLWGALRTLGVIFVCTMIIACVPAAICGWVFKKSSMF
jgi:hypothetical protein